MSKKSKVIRVGKTITVVLEHKGASTKMSKAGTKEEYDLLKSLIGDGENLKPEEIHTVGRIMMPLAYEEEMKIKKEQSKENVEKLKDLKEKKKKKAIRQGAIMTADTEVPNIVAFDGVWFLKGFTQVPMPEFLQQKLREANADEQVAYINFWKWCLLNPNPQARNDFFKYASTHNMPITQNGFAVGYKRVVSVGKTTEEVNTSLIEYVSEAALKVKKAKKGLQRFFVWMFGGEFKHGEKLPEGAEEVGNLKDLAEKTAEQGKSVQLYTDHWTKTMDIRLGVPVVMAKKDCDSNPKNDCSYGLHVGAPQYVAGFSGDTALLVFFNPMDVVAVPHYDASKLRTSRYIPYAVLGKNTHISRETLEKENLSVYDEEFSKMEFERLDGMLDAARRKGLIQDGELAEVSEEQLRTVKEFVAVDRVAEAKEIKKQVSKRVKPVEAPAEALVEEAPAETPMEAESPVVEEKKPFYRVTVKNTANKVSLAKFLKDEFGLGLKEAKAQVDQLPLAFTLEVEKAPRWKEEFKKIGVEAHFKKR